VQFDEDKKRPAGPLAVLPVFWVPPDQPPHRLQARMWTANSTFLSGPGKSNLAQGHIGLLLEGYGQILGYFFY
jgi:hypothetical protein